MESWLQALLAWFTAGMMLDTNAALVLGPTLRVCAAFIFTFLSRKGIALSDAKKKFSIFALAGLLIGGIKYFTHAPIEGDALIEIWIGTGAVAIGAHQLTKGLTKSGA